MPKYLRGEAWLVDLGLAAKTRPCVLLTDSPKPEDLALVVVVPHTTVVRGSSWEFPCPKQFLQQGVFHLQQIRAAPEAYLVRKLGVLTQAEMEDMSKKLREKLRL